MPGARSLCARADVCEAHGVFPAAMLEAQAKMLRSYDSDEAAKALHDPDLMAALVSRYFYCG